MKIAFSLICLASLSTSAVASPRGSKPDWTNNGQSAQYPRARFVVGVGIADDLASAEDRARGEIARVFSALVTVKTSVDASETNIKTGTAEKSSFAQTVSHNVQTASRKLLEGVEVRESWQDDATKQYYALAVLERSKGITSLTDKISDFDKQALHWKTQLETSERLPKVRAAMKILAILKAREELNSELRVLDAEGGPGGRGRASVRRGGRSSRAEVYDVTVVR